MISWQDALVMSLSVLGAGLGFWGFSSWRKDRELWRERVGPKGFPLVPGYGLISSLSILVGLASLNTRNSNITGPEKKGHERKDIHMLLDVSRSMGVSDGELTRFDEAKRQMDLLIRDLPEERLGLATFSGTLTIRCPLSRDHETLLRQLDRLEVGMEPVMGTDLGTAVASLLDRLGPAEKGTSIIIFSDGEDLEESWIPSELAKEATIRGVRISSVGVGSGKGSTIPTGDGLTFITDEEGHPVVSRSDFTALLALAELSEGLFVSAEGHPQAALKLAQSIRSETNRVARMGARGSSHRSLWIGLAFVLLMVGGFGPRRWGMHV